jgi:thiosulfate/3-mercaptopyruvate sulfurtransferase
MRPRVPHLCIDVDAAAKLIGRDDTLAFDVRDAASFANGGIHGARHLTQTNLTAFITGTAKRTPILIYCYRGHASREYAQTFSDFGFTEVYSMDGGYEAWAGRQRMLEVAAAPDEALRDWLAAHGFGSDVNAVIANETTALMKAAHQGATVMISKLLVTGARLEARNADGNNALWLACAGNHPDAIDALVEAGIDIDNQNLNGATALMYASSSGKAELVARLLAQRADTSLETPDGFTALDMAASAECLALLRPPRNRERGR